MADEGIQNPRRPGIAGRLTPIDRTRDLLPVRRADRLTHCFLYWVPVDSTPIPSSQRTWLMRFFDGLGEMLRDQFGLRAEVFIQMKSIYPALQKAFLDTSMDFSPVLGIGRRPATDPPAIPSDEDVKAFLTLEKKFDLDRTFPDFCYWFVDKLERKQREFFFGYGGISIIFLKPDPKTQAPKLPFSPATRKQPVFKQFDVDKIHARTFSLMDGFLENSKRLFGSGLEGSAFKDVPFVLPLLRSEDFFSRPEDELDKWFELFDVYVRESPEDKGIIIASKRDFEESLISLLKKMKEDEQLEYPAE